VLFGFSQGGAMALDSGCALPIAGLISCSGYPHPNLGSPTATSPCVADAWFRRSRGAVRGHASDHFAVAAGSMSDASIQKRPHHPRRNGAADRVVYRACSEERLIKRRRTRTPPFPPNHQRQAQVLQRACLRQWNQRWCATTGRGNDSLRRIAH
jgi:hypothetical protein